MRIVIAPGIEIPGAVRQSVNFPFLLGIPIHVATETPAAIKHGFQILAIKRNLRIGAAIDLTGLGMQEADTGKGIFLSHPDTHPTHILLMGAVFKPATLCRDQVIIAFASMHEMHAFLLQLMITGDEKVGDIFPSG